MKNKQKAEASLPSIKKTVKPVCKIGNQKL